MTATATKKAKPAPAPKVPEASIVLGVVPKGELLEIRLDAIKDPPGIADRIEREGDADRIQETARSLREVGQLQPIMVEQGSKTGEYIRVFGRRRLAAARLNLKEHRGTDSILAIVVPPLEPDVRRHRGGPGPARGRLGHGLCPHQVRPGRRAERGAGVTNTNEPGRRRRPHSKEQHVTTQAKTRTGIVQSSALLSNRTDICDTLTDSQLRIVDLLLAGKSAREIAEAVERSVNTVHDHIKAVYKKLKINKRVELVLLFAQPVASGVGAGAGGGA